MRLNLILAPLTIVLLIFTGFNVVSHILRKNAMEAGAGGAREESRKVVPSGMAEETSLMANSTSLLMTGVSSHVPVSEDYTVLNTIPWDFKDINRLFREAGVSGSCQLMDSGVEVVQQLGAVASGQAGPLGRRSVFSIRLQVGKELGEGLPGISRGIIEDYLRVHQLTVQASFYHDAAGQFFLSPDVQAAFIRLDSPELTVTPEEMIRTSIGQLRTLGAYWPSNESFSASSCRTLIFGFYYEVDSDRLSSRPISKKEFELVFLHVLPESTPGNPKVAVFATSDGRTQFHLLEETDPDNAGQIASVTADVRFADAQLLGMMPTAPVVTRVKHRALLSLPVDTVKLEIEGLGGQAPKDGFDGLLDDFYRRATGTDPVQASPKEPEPHVDQYAGSTPHDEDASADQKAKIEPSEDESPASENAGEKSGNNDAERPGKNKNKSSKPSIEV